MKRYISTLALCALAFIGLNSCNKAQEVDLENGTRTVTFQVQMGPDTRTGLSVKFVPDWTDTKIANVHLFEDHKGNHMEGKNVKMEIDENNDEIAYFSADYTDEWTIIVDPTMPETRASATDYVYTGVVAQRTGEGDNAKYVVPAVQNPGKNTLIDPDADFLVGRAPEAYTSGQSLKQVDMIFKRPVSVSRLAIWGIPEGEKVQEVKISSADKLTGSVALSGIDFENRTVAAFDETSGSTTITLNYGSGEAVPAEAFFNAYFISLPGAKKILSIEVTTDQKTYIKEFDGGKTLTFKTPDFKSIAVNMLDTATDDGKQERDLHFVKGQTTVTTDAYDIWDTTNQTYSGDYVAPTLAGTTEGATPVWNSSEPDVATVDAEGNVTIVGAGTTDITVFVASSDTYKSGNAAFTLTVSDSTPAAQNQPLKFVDKNSVDLTSLTLTYDLKDKDTTPFESPKLAGNVAGSTVTWAIEFLENDNCASIAEDGTVTPLQTGLVTVTATASAVAPLYLETSKSYSLQIVDTTPAPGTTYSLVTKEEDVVAGTYLIVAAADDKIFDGSGTYHGGYTAIADADAITRDAEKNQITITGDKAAYEFAFAKSGSGFTITGQQGMIIAAANDGASTSTETYITFAATGGSVFLQRGKLTTDEKALLFSTTRGTSSEEYIYFNSNGFFKIGGSGKTNGIHLYAANRAAQTIAFANAEGLTYDLYPAGEAFTEPTLSGAKTTVTYASSDEKVATVDANGEVTFKAAGTVTITATAAATAEYFSASASYTVVVSDSSPKTPGFYKVTSTADLTVGAKYILVFEGIPGDTDGDADPKVFKPTLASNTTFSKATSNGVAVEINNGKISPDGYNDCLLTLEEGYYLKADAANSYLYPSGSGNSSGTLSAESTASNNLTISFGEDGIAQIKAASGTFYLVWSISSHYFSSNASLSGQYSTGICLYRLDDDRTPQTLTVSGTEAKYDLGTSTWTVAVPTVSGNVTTPLSWASSDESVATVDASGNITPKAKGTTTITATAPSSSTVKSGSVSFTVTVINSAVPTYYKVDELENGQSYLIVSNGYALGLNGTNVAAAAVTATEVADEIKFDATESSLWKASVSGTSVKVMNGSNYLRHATQTKTNFSIGTTDSNNSITYDAANNTVMLGSNYLYYSSNSSAFKLGSADATHVAAFYSETKPKPSLTFDKSAVTYDLNGGNWDGNMPVLSPANAAVNYTFVNNGSASIIESVNENGVVTLVASPTKGTATVTATAKTPADYKVSSVSYTVTVINSAEIPTYTKVDEITSGATYLIVSTDSDNYNNLGQKRAFAGDTAGTAVEVDGTSGTITGDFSAVEFVITKEGDNYVLNGPNGYVTGQSSTDPYIQVSSSKVTMSLTDAATLKAASSGDGKVSDAFYFYYTKTSGSSTSKEVLYLNTNTKFKMGGSGRKYGVYLYKKN